MHIILGTEQGLGGLLVQLADGLEIVLNDDMLSTGIVDIEPFRNKIVETCERYRELSEDHESLRQLISEIVKLTLGKQR